MSRLDPVAASVPGAGPGRLPWTRSPDAPRRRPRPGRRTGADPGRGAAARWVDGAAGRPGELAALAGSARRWARGWDRAEHAPADPGADASPGRRGWQAPDGRPVGDGWREAHERRRVLVRACRRAGYVARHRWPRVERARYPRPDGSERVVYEYEAGPARGSVAVDPWQVARRLQACGAVWEARLAVGPGGATVRAAPMACGMRHVCPVCAARRSAEIAGTLRDRIAGLAAAAAAAGAAAPRLALVTLTQRAHAGEELAAALDRWRAGLRRLHRGRARAEWAGRIAGHYYGVEVTRGDGGAWWHVHGHLVVILADGVEHADAAAWLGPAWRTASERSAVEAGRPGYGWDPVAGGVTAEAAAAGAWAGPWWREIDPADLAAVYQACKYPTPISRLADPAHLAEFLAVAHGRRWHEGGGLLRGLHAEADADEGPADEGADGAADAVPVSVAGPRSPLVEHLAPELSAGPAGEVPRAVPRIEIERAEVWRRGWVAWRLAAAAVARHGPGRLAELLAAVGGAVWCEADPAGVQVWHARAPASWAAQELRCRSAAASTATAPPPSPP